MAGQEVTLSYWAKSASAQTLSEVQVAQYFGATGSATVNTTLTAPSITTSWVRYTHTFTMPSISGKTISGGNDAIYINIKGAINNALDIWGVQLEAGSVATAFQTATGTLQGELAACQRYYLEQGGSTVYEYMGMGLCTATTTAKIQYYFPVVMRTTPSLSYSAIGDLSVALANGNLQVLTALSTTGESKQATGLTATVAANLVAGNATFLLASNTTNARIKFSAEL